MGQNVLKIFDVGANLTDGMFKGIYHGRQVHSSDLKNVLERAKSFGIEKIMVTAGCLAEVRESIKLLEEVEEEFPGMLTTTVGVHPTRCNEFDEYSSANNYMEELLTFARQHQKFKIKAIGEFGLDYDRVQFCQPAMQRKYFEEQFKLADETKLPLFLHMRDAAGDFIEIIKRNRHRFKDGVVHSFTGTMEEAKELLDLDLYIGINGCSLKSVENLNVIKSIPINRMMVESDAPWCEIRPSHAGHSLINTKFKTMAKEKHDPNFGIKSRNEPSSSLQVLECIAALHQLPLELIANEIYNTTNQVFG